MSWDDNDFGVEYAKFTKAYIDDDPLCTEDTTVLYCKVHWNTITDYVNSWNKKRKKVRIERILLCKNTPYDEDKIEENDNLWLDMGSRLFNCLKNLKSDKPSCVKIIKNSNPRDRFDTWYVAGNYKLSKQAKISKK